MTSSLPLPPPSLGCFGASTESCLFLGVSNLSFLSLDFPSLLFFSSFFLSFLWNLSDLSSALPSSLLLFFFLFVLQFFPTPSLRVVLRLLGRLSLLSYVVHDLVLSLARHSRIRENNCEIPPRRARRQSILYVVSAQQQEQEQKQQQIEEKRTSRRREAPSMARSHLSLFLRKDLFLAVKKGEEKRARKQQKKKQKKGREEGKRAGRENARQHS